VLNVFVATGGTGSVVNARPVVPDTIPMVFAMGGDPVKLGIVASLARPGDNITGVAFLLSELAPKQVELLHQLVPKAAVIGFLVDPKDPVTESDTKNAQVAADLLGHELVVVKASNASEIAPAFDALAQQNIKAVFINAEPSTRCVHRAGAEGRETGRSTCAAVNKIPARRQSEDRQGARSGNPSIGPRPRRRRHRIAAAFRVNAVLFPPEAPQPVRGNGRCGA